MDPLQENKYYTYADYLTWPEDVRYELIDGVPYLMAPPKTNHQRVSRNLLLQLGNFLEGKPCEVFGAPFGVRLNAAEGDDTVLEPDIVVVCDDSKLDDRGCVGAPDMIIEILSPSTLARDRVIKLNRYLQAGVREYWVVDPDGRTVSVHILKAGEYVISAYADTDTVSVHVLEGCAVDLSKVFTV